MKISGTMNDKIATDTLTDIKRCAVVFNREG